MEKREIKFKYTFGIDGNEQTYFSEVLTIGQIENGHMHIVLTDVFDQTQNNGYSVLYKRQSTGMFMQGVEVFEGDLVSNNFGLSKQVIRQVVFDRGQWLLMRVSGKSKLDFILNMFEYKDFSYKVVGTIYENPELLNKKD